MIARISTLQAPPQGLEAGIASVGDQVFPAVQHMAGFKGIVAFADRSSGKLMAITLWESEDDLRASEEAANALRASAAQVGSAQILGVERLEVTFNSMM